MNAKHFLAINLIFQLNKESIKKSTKLHQKSPHKQITQSSYLQINQHKNLDGALLNKMFDLEELIMVMLRGDKAIAAAGLTPTHAKAFQQVADQCMCVIMSRSVNPACTQLIEEGYASKGFKVKAKSCNWGPMAGFILADPRFSKLGSQPDVVANQQKDLQAAFDAGADSVPVYISDARISYLKTEKLIEIVKESSEQITCIGTSGNKDKITFLLQKDTAKKLWGVYYAPVPNQDSYAVTKENRFVKQPSSQGAPLPVRAMTNPGIDSHRGEHAPGFPDYRKAVTGDYDLFAVMAMDGSKLSPEEKKKIIADGYMLYDENDLDMRYMKIGALKTDKEELKRENSTLGNMTIRLGLVRDYLNSTMQSLDKSGRNMIHHSDETGRPFEPELEYPIIAFIPNNLTQYFDLNNFKQTTVYGLQSGRDLAILLSVLQKKFAVIINTSWKQVLDKEFTKIKADQKDYRIPSWQDVDQGKRADYLKLNFDKEVQDQYFQQAAKDLEQQKAA